MRNDYIYMCAPTFIHGSAGVLIVYRKIFVYISSPDISSVDTSPDEVYSHPSACMHLSAQSRSIRATGKPLCAAYASYLALSAGSRRTFMLVMFSFCHWADCCLCRCFLSSGVYIAFRAIGCTSAHMIPILSRSVNMSIMFYILTIIYLQSKIHLFYL